MPPSYALAPAPLWRRLAAAAYDLLLVLALLMMVTGLVLLARAGRLVDPGSFWFQLLLLGAWWLYFGWSWTHGGQTVGMRAWRLVLTGPAADDPVSWRQASIRFAVAWFSTLTAGLGFLASLISRDRLTWHDRLSQTRLQRKLPLSAAAESQSR